jgi:uncharacterized protein YuzE
MRFFGKRFDTAAYQDCEQTSPPIGQPCAYCRVPIVADDDGWLMPQLSASGPAPELPYHRECHLRSVCGSVEHLLLFGRPCPGTCRDDPSLTKRQAALAAAHLWLHGQLSVPVQIDMDNNVAYIALDPRPPKHRPCSELSRSGRSERLRDVVLDFDETGRLIGIELLDAEAVFGARKPQGGNE